MAVRSLTRNGLNDITGLGPNCLWEVGVSGHLTFSGSFAIGLMVDFMLATCILTTLRFHASTLHLAWILLLMFGGENPAAVGCKSLYLGSVLCLIL